MYETMFSAKHTLNVHGSDILLTQQDYQISHINVYTLEGLCITFDKKQQKQVLIIEFQVH